MNIEDLPPEFIEHMEELERLARAGIAYTPPPNVIADIVKFQRAALGCKQAALAAMADVSLTTIERIERGEKVSDDSLDRVAAVFGYEKGAFTEPRVPATPEEMDVMVRRWSSTFDNRVLVPVRPLRTQPQIAALARTHMYLIEGNRLGDDFSDDMASLYEALDFVAYILCNDDEGISTGRGEPLKRRELYTMVLDQIRVIERRGNAVALGGVYQASTTNRFLPIADVALIAFFPRNTDPAACKRKFLLAPEKVESCIAWGDCEPPFSGARKYPDAVPH